MSSGAGILVGVCSCHSNPAKREAVRKTWAKVVPEGVRVVFFEGRSDEKPVDGTLVLDVDDGYRNLAGKVREFLRVAVDRYDFDWLFKCDDDTYVSLERLAGLVEEGGFDHAGNAAFMNYRGTASGGAGYLLSRRLVESIAVDRDLPDEGPEDVVISGAAVRISSSVLKTDRLWYNHDRYPRRDNDIVTSHWLNPARMEVVHHILVREPWHTLRVSHAAWEDDVVLFEEGSCARSSAYDCGTWDVAEGKLVIRWFGGRVDTLELSGS